MGLLNTIRGQAGAAIAQHQRQCRPARQGVADRRRQFRLPGNPPQGRLEPFLQPRQQRSAARLARGQP